MNWYKVFDSDGLGSDLWGYGVTVIRTTGSERGSGVSSLKGCLGRAVSIVRREVRDVRGDVAGGIARVYWGAGI